MASPLLLAQHFLSSFLDSSATSAGPQSANGTAASNSNQSATTPAAFPTDLTSLITFLFGFSALRDWVKLFVIGSLFESFRRLAMHFHWRALNSFFVTARFEEEDSAYDWMMLWLSQQPSFKTARDVHVTSQSFGLSSSNTLVEGENEDAADVLNGARPLLFLPSSDVSHTIWYRKHWMRVRRSSQEGGYYGRKTQYLEICILAWDTKVLNKLILDAKKAYNDQQEHRVSVFISDSNNCWHLVASRPKRPMKSIVLDPGIKDQLMDDAKDFLDSKPWYAARGIPFRRGYLLYGAPGSGKTSIIHSMAGELGLNVYVISLSRSGMDDTALSELIADLPEKCIALMEDVDAAFNQTMNREEVQEETKEPNDKPKQGGPSRTSTSRISLSGLLNALDGVGAQEGRILFATTNKYHALDSALCRPGRMDVHIEFNLASRYQAEELYRCFYMPDDELPESGHVSDKTSEKTFSDSGYGSDSDEKALPPSPTSPTSHSRRTPRLSLDQVASLATEFAAAVPEREFSMASLQGYLMAYKIRPYDAVKDVPMWVEKERDAERKRKLSSKKESVPPINSDDPASEVKLER